MEDREFKETPLPQSWWKYTDGCHSVPFIGGDTSGMDGYNIIVQETTPRVLLQQLGTECGRGIIHNDIWVNATMSEYEEKDNWLITDCRFINEAKIVTIKGGMSIRVNRPIHSRFPELWDKFFHLTHSVGDLDEKNFLIWLKSQDLAMWNKLTHESETALDNYKDFTHIINNDGTFENLIEKVRGILVLQGIL